MQRHLVVHLLTCLNLIYFVITPCFAIAMKRGHRLKAFSVFFLIWVYPTTQLKYLNVWTIGRTLFLRESFLGNRFRVASYDRISFGFLKPW